MLSRSQTDIGPGRLFNSSKRQTSASTLDMFGSSSPATSTSSFTTYDDSKSLPRINSMVRTVSGTIGNRIDPRQEIRAHLFGDGSEVDLSSPQNSESEGKSTFIGAARGVKNRLSRTSTMVSQLPRTRKSSSQPPIAQTRLTMNPASTIAEVEDTEQVANQIKERAFYDKLAAQQHNSSFDDETPYEAVCSPIRRRSLLTPGIATRNQSDILQKPPMPKLMQPAMKSDDYFGAHSPGVSPLGRIAALDLANCERTSPQPRTGTPSDLTYGHLGGLRSGSLRVVNGGSDSPTPPDEALELQRSKTTSNLRYEEDYFTTSEGRKSDKEKAQAAMQERTSGPVRPTEEVAPRETSFLKHEAPMEDIAVGYAVRRKSVSTQPWEPKVSSSQSAPAPPQRQHGAASLADHYISQLPDSPYKAPSPGAISQRSGYTRDSEHSSNSSVQSLVLNSSSNAVTALSPQSILTASVRKSRCFSESSEILRKSSSSSGPVSDKGENHSQMSTHPRPSLVTASTSSTTDSQSQACESSTFDSSDTNTSMSSFENADSAVSLKPKRLLQKPRPASQPPAARLSTVRADREVHQYGIPAVPSNLVLRHAQRDSQYPSLGHTYPSLQHTALKHMSSGPEIKALQVRFPSPTGKDSPSETPKKNDWGSPEIKPAKKSRFSWRLRTPSGNSTSGRSSSGPFDIGDVDVNATIADFGTVAQSLGKSPYDIARNPVDGSRSRRGTSLSLCHPHQITAANPVPKIIGMSGEEAAKLARGRSHDRSQSFQTTASSTKPEWNQRFEQEQCQTLPGTEMRSPANFSRRPSGQGNMKIPKKLQRPKVLDTDIPPVPAMPPVAKIQSREAEVKRASSLNCQSKPVVPTAISVNPTGPNPVEDASFLTVSPVSASPSTGWERQSAVWAQRRKSANDGLLLRPQSFLTVPVPDKTGSGNVKTVSKPQSSSSYKAFNPDVPALPFNPSPSPFYSVQPLSASKDPVRPAPAIPVNARRSFHIPLRVHQPTGSPGLRSHNGSTASLQAMPNGEDSTNIKRLSGRYEGGYGFGYEPGYGIGGSAGTRGMKTGASRKSVDVSVGFGIDLSDVPIFVAPN